jgi:hypothetical protein
MKTFVLTLSLCSLFSAGSFSQTLTNNYLIGTWNINDSTHNTPSMSLVFKDSTHVKLVIPDEGSAHLMYSVVRYNNQAVLLFRGTDTNNKKTHMYWFIKILDDKTMEAEEPLYSPKSYKWSDELAITMVRQNDQSVVMQ